MKDKTIMKFSRLLLPALLLLPVILSSCSSYETYAEQKEKERDAISAFLTRDVCIREENGDTLIHVGIINTIDEETFIKQDSSTDISKNEYVLFGNTGVYMQIVRRGLGEKLAEGKTARVICRFVEYNILGDSIQLRSDINRWHSVPDIMKISNSYGSFSAYFDSDIIGEGAMYQRYASSSVPSGWLVPFSYIRLGRQGQDANYDYDKDGGIAKVRLIVPHSEGQSEASNNVYPCFYEITFQRTRD